MTGGEVEVAREENGASLEGEERGAGVFLGRGGGDDFLEEEEMNFLEEEKMIFWRKRRKTFVAYNPQNYYILFCSLVLKYQKINFCSSILAVEN